MSILKRSKNLNKTVGIVVDALNCPGMRLRRAYANMDIMPSSLLYRVLAGVVGLAEF